MSLARSGAVVPTGQPPARGSWALTRWVLQGWGQLCPACILAGKHLGGGALASRVDPFCSQPAAVTPGLGTFCEMSPTAPDRETRPGPGRENHGPSRAGRETLIQSRIVCPITWIFSLCQTYWPFWPDMCPCRTAGPLAQAGPIPSLQYEIIQLNQI